MSVKVAFFTPPSRGVVAGIERVNVNLASGLTSHRADWDVFHLLSEDLNGLPPTSPGLSTHMLHAHRLGQAIPRLLRWTRMNQPDVVVLPQVVPTTMALLGLRFGFGSRKTRVISVIHGNVDIEASKGVRDRLFYALAPQAYNHYSDAVVGVSQGATQAAHRRLALDSIKVQTIYNPVLTPEWLSHATDEIGDPWVAGDVPIVLGVGRLEPQKDFPTLIKAFRIVREELNSRLLIVGDGPQRGALGHLIQRLDLAKDARLAGFVPHPAPYMRASSVFVLSSRYEGFGNVLVEAMASGVPVVSTDCPHGPSEILQNGALGALVAPDDPEELAGAVIASLRSNHPETVQRARDFAGQFTLESAVRRYDELISEIVAST